jgi:hypothetical protein
LPFHTARLAKRRGSPENVMTYIDSPRLDCESTKSAKTFVTRVTFWNCVECRSVLGRGGSVPCISRFGRKTLNLLLEREERCG